MSELSTILLRDTGLTRAQLDEAQQTMRVEGGTLTEVLLTSKALPEDDLLRAVAQQQGLAFSSKLELDEVDGELVEPLPITYAKTHLVLPLHREDGTIKVAMANPDAIFAADDLRTMLDGEITPVLANSEQVLELINRTYAKLQTGGVDLEDDDEFAGNNEEQVDILDSTDDAPIIKWVNSLIFQAVKERASDIHIEPGEREVVVRYRIDGVLYEQKEAPRNAAASITARVKIMAGLNIAEKRLPQDGRIRRRIAGKDIDMRVATAPTARGERITIRLLDKTAVVLNLADIGFGPDHLREMDELIRRPNGIVLVTGPTGSGKTTTLYASLSEINTPDKNILTIEDPVEYQLEGISQTQVNSKIDLTFASGLRSFLRHDPDVIMVGEIRDLETAEIAIQASLTGHLVFSTLHTNDAPGAITRLIDMDVEPFLVASSVLALLAQRLVRKICPECKELKPVTADEVAGLGMSMDEYRESAGKDFGFHDDRRPPPPAGMAYHAAGCSSCLNTGYSGRLGIYELLPMDDMVRSAVLKRTDANTIKRAAIAGGAYRTLRQDGASKILSGLTTIEEVMRVTQEDVL
jgi:general secretion pathway protein E